MGDFYNKTTGTPWICTCCSKETKSIYYVNGKILCEDCYRKKFDKTFDPYSREDMKKLIKESIKEYFDGR